MSFKQKLLLWSLVHTKKNIKKMSFKNAHNEHKRHTIKFNTLHNPQQCSVTNKNSFHDPTLSSEFSDQTPELLLLLVVSEKSPET